MALPAFQSVVNATLPLAVEGDFCAANPFFSTLAGEGAFTAGALPVTVGRFGFVNSAGQISNNAAGYVRMGFIGLRGQPVIITPWLGGYGMQVQPGFEMTLWDAAPVFMRFAAGATIGQKVFASYADGTAIAGTAGAVLAGTSFTGVIAASVLTVSALTGTIALGQPISGTGVTAGTYVLNQLTGTAGAAGTYTVVGTTTAGSTAMTSSSGLESRWYVDSTAAAGELAMCSTRG